VRSPDEFEDDFSEGDGFDRTTLEFLMTNILTIKLQIRAFESELNPRIFEINCEKVNCELYGYLIFLINN